MKKDATSTQPPIVTRADGSYDTSRVAMLRPVPVVLAFTIDDIVHNLIAHVPFLRRLFRRLLRSAARGGLGAYYPRKRNATPHIKHDASDGAWSLLTVECADYVEVC